MRGRREGGKTWSTGKAYLMPAYLPVLMAHSSTLLLLLPLLLPPLLPSCVEVTTQLLWHFNTDLWCWDLNLPIIQQHPRPYRKQEKWRTCKLTARGKKWEHREELGARVWWREPRKQADLSCILCMCLWCACLWKGRHLYTQRLKEEVGCPVLSLPASFPWDRVFHWSLPRLVANEPRNCPVSGPNHTGVTGMCDQSYLGFYIGAGDLNLGLHGDTANALLILSHLPGAVGVWRRRNEMWLMRILLVAFAVIKHYNQGNLQKESFIWAYSSL